MYKITGDKGEHAVFENKESLIHYIKSRDFTGIRIKKIKESDIITQKRLQELYSYDVDGFLVCKQKIHSNNSKNKIGDRVGYFNEKKRICIVGLNKRTYYLHQLIYLYHHGYIPAIIDHIDRNPMNNRIENLRESSVKSNLANKSDMTGKKKNKTGFTGVSQTKNGKRFFSSINQKLIGYYDTAEEAHEAYKREHIKLHGHHSRYYSK